MRYPSTELDGFDALRSHPARWFFRQVTVYLAAAAFTAAVLVAGAAIYAYLGVPANPAASVPVPLHGMSVLGWILLGLIAGFISSKIVNREGQGFLLDIVLGIVGAVVGGFLFSAIGAIGFNLYSMFVAVVGATVLLWVYHAIAGRQ
jgi:uncharacterized membrane protein YeaQ/YmgE (transglycosylase-associated protein family)